MPNLADLMAKETLTQQERAQLRDRINVLEASLSNMKKLLNIQAHIASTNNPHGTTAAQVGALATTAFVGLSIITVAATPPGTPSVNDLWIQI
jgi:hypothetical protein